MARFVRAAERPLSRQPWHICWSDRAAPAISYPSQGGAWDRELAQAASLRYMRAPGSANSLLGQAGLALDANSPSPRKDRPGSSGIGLPFGSYKVETSAVFRSILLRSQEP